MYLYINGDVYEGEWKDNKRQGKGVYTCAATKLKVCSDPIILSFNIAKHGLPVKYRSLNLPPSIPHMELSDNNECFAEVTQNWNFCIKITTKTDRFFMQRLVETAKIHKDSLQTRKNELSYIHEPLSCRPHISITSPQTSSWKFHFLKKFNTINKLFIDLEQRY